MKVDDLLLLSKVLLVITIILLIITIISFYKLKIRKALHIVMGKTFKFKPTSGIQNLMVISNNKTERRETDANMKTKFLEAEQTRVLEINETKVLISNIEKDDVTAVLKVIDK